MDFKLPERGSWSRRPTPIQKLDRLSQEWGINLFVKRDDLTGLEWSGNKIRKLDFLVQDALLKGANCLITCGGVQSNHCRATAALAAKLGLRCVLLLRGEKPKQYSSNNLLDQLFGAEIFYLTNEQYYNQGDLRQALDAQIRSQGGKSYYIPEGGSNALGTMGYLSVFEEILEQIKDQTLSMPAFDSMIVAHGSGGTQAGLVLGKILHEQSALGDTKVIGVNVCYDKERSFRLVKDILWSAIQQFNLPLSFLSDDIQILDGFVGEGYAKSTTEELRFLKKIASTEGLLLDPVYTGKAMFGLSQTLKKADHSLGKNILFLHTGGAFGDFQLNAEWSEALS